MGTYTGTNFDNTASAVKEWSWNPFSFGYQWNSWKMYGRGGNDHLTGGPKDDWLYGEDGNDLLYGKEGNDRLYGGNGGDRLYGQEGNDVAYGDAGIDILIGDQGNDALYGGDDADYIYGGADNDTLDGGNGNDTLGGYGGKPGETDSLTGGAGADKFILGDYYGQSYYTGAGYAVINDFKWFEGDKIQVHGKINDYTLEKRFNFLGSSTKDTAIYKGSDLIAIVKDTTSVIASLDFIEAPEPIIT